MLRWLDLAVHRYLESELVDHNRVVVFAKTWLLGSRCALASQN
jgi:hypothetical protein